jgi:hypothetical protein
MKTLITNYSFNALQRKITFNDYTSILLERVLLITNVKNNIIIYNFADPTKGGTVSGNVLTLTYDTTSMGNTDDLQIFYDDPASPATEGTLQKSLGLSGTGVDTTFTLTNANTSYAIPTNPPVDFYTLVIYNASDTDIYLRFTSGVTAGIKIASDTSFAIDLGEGQQVYVYCGLANKTINLSYKII